MVSGSPALFGRLVIAAAMTVPDLSLNTLRPKKEQGATRSVHS